MERKVVAPTSHFFSLLSAHPVLETQNFLLLVWSRLTLLAVGLMMRIGDYLDKLGIYKSIGPTGFIISRIYLQ